MGRLICIIAVVGIASLVSAENYPTKYDDIDINAILSNDRLRNQHRKCYMDIGPCVTADMKFFKAFIAEAVVTNCKKCSEKQKENLNILADWYTKNEPEKWNEFIANMIDKLRKQKRWTIINGKTDDSDYETTMVIGVN